MTEATTPKQVIVYAKESGKEPFTEWLYGLRDVMGRKRILARISRLQQGNYGDCEPVGDGVSCSDLQSKTHKPAIEGVFDLQSSMPKTQII